MLFTKNYTILDKFSKIVKISTPLCILKTPSVCKNFNKFVKIIDKNPNVEFWIATDNCSKKTINKAYILGIKNVISLPIDEKVILEYFNISNSSYKKEVPSSIFNFPNTKVAIVDDNDMNIKLLSEILSDLNTQIYSYINPESILNTLETEKFDLFLLDVLMPNISGLELAVEIKKSKLNSTAPIVFVSAMSDVETKLSGYEIGAYSYIEKPYNVEIVKSQISNLLKKQEDYKNINTQKENFVAMLTHDLKSPINAEINALELLIGQKFGKMPDNQQEIIGSVLNSAKYMKHITDQILSFYKSNNGVVTLSKEETVFEEVVIDAVKSMRFLLEEKNQKILIKNSLHSETAQIDIIEIKRVINNLIGNAIEYSPENSDIIIELSKNVSYFKFTIIDNGYGVDSENMENIFDEYISLAKKQKRVGFGLGLNICKKIILAHGGTITMDSKVGIGTKIEFTIPRK